MIIHGVKTIQRDDKQTHLIVSCVYVGIVEMTHARDLQQFKCHPFTLSQNNLNKTNKS